MIEGLVRHFYADLWEAGREEHAAQILHSDLVFRGSIGQQARGIDGFIRYLRMVRHSFADYRCDIVSLVSSGGQAAARMRFHGIQRAQFLGFEPTGRRVEWAGAAFFELRDSRLADIWVLGDTDGLRAQLRDKG